MAEAYGAMFLIGIAIHAIFGKGSKKKIVPTNYNPHFYD